jgi:hypothetical protein
VFSVLKEVCRGFAGRGQTLRPAKPKIRAKPKPTPGRNSQNLVIPDSIRNPESFPRREAPLSSLSPDICLLQRNAPQKKEGERFALLK